MPVIVRTKEELVHLISEAKESNDWTEVQTADVSEITDMDELFEFVKGIENLDLSLWDTSNVTTMKYMFFNSDFNAPLSFDTRNVKDMSNMLSDTPFNHPLHFDTRNVRIIKGMLTGCQYNHPLNLNMRKVINMEYMFSGSEFNQPLTLDIPKAININNMFSGSKFNQPLHLKTTALLESAERMFKDSPMTFPVPWIDKVNKAVLGKAEIIRLHDRNQRLHDFIDNEVVDVESLMEEFSDRDDILSTIKDIQLNRDLEGSSNTNTPLPKPMPRRF